MARFEWYQPWKVYNAFRHPERNEPPMNKFSAWTRWEAFTWTITRCWDRFPLSKMGRLSREIKDLEKKLGFKMLDEEEK